MDTILNQYIGQEIQNFEETRSACFWTWRVNFRSCPISSSQRREVVHSSWCASCSRFRWTERAYTGTTRKEQVARESRGSARYGRVLETQKMRTWRVTFEMNELTAADHLESLGSIHASRPHHCTRVRRVVSQYLRVGLGLDSYSTRRPPWRFETGLARNGQARRRLSLRPAR